MTHHNIPSLGKIYRLKANQFFFQNIQKLLHSKYKTDECNRSKEKYTKSFKFYFPLFKILGQNLELKQEVEYSEDNSQIDNNNCDIEFYDLTGCILNYCEKVKLIDDII